MRENIKQIIDMVWRALVSNKTRSFLTMLGIIIGVAAVVIIMAVGSGAQALILDQLEGSGNNSLLIAVLPGASDVSGPPASVFGITVTTLNMRDVVALEQRRNVSHAEAVAAYYDIDLSVSYNQLFFDASIVGTTANYFEVEGGSLKSGRFFTQEEVNGAARVAVLGSNVADELFFDSDPVGQRIRIKNQNVEIIGVLEPRDQGAFQNYDNQIISPITFIQRQIAGVSHLSAIRIKVDDVLNIEQSINEIEQTLREQRSIVNPEDDDFSVRSFKDAIELVATVTDAIRYFLAAMAALSLLVGGIGIMNIMLVSVTERTREIGLRKSVGANNWQIMRQFLLESVGLTLIGGLIGLIIGIIISYLIYIGAIFLGYQWAFVISWLAIFLAISISILIGLIFGLYPARRASRLLPIEALRYE